MAPVLGHLKLNTAPLAQLKAFTIKPHSQFDIIVNDIQGVKPNDYGTVFIKHSHSQIDGRMSYYKLAQGGADYEFAFALPFGNPSRGTSGVNFNTIQPSVAEEERNRAVYNWLTIANSESFEQKFTCTYYDSAGKQLKRSVVSVAPYQRQDIDGGHGVAGFVSVGSIAVLPSNTQARYVSVLVRYGSLGTPSQGLSSYNFAFPVQALPGSAATQIVPLTLASGIKEVVEIANFSAKGGDVELSIFDSSGKQIGSKLKVSIGSNAQQHLDVAELLGTRSSGTLVVQPLNNLAAYSAVTSFYRNPESGGLLTANRTEAKKSYGMELGGSYNLYLGMTNWLRISNPLRTKVGFVLELETPSGVQSFSRSILASGRMDLPLHDAALYGTAPNSYGAVRLRPPAGASLVADLIRTRANPAGSPDFIFNTPLR